MLVAVGALSMSAAAAYQAQQQPQTPRITSVDKVKDNF
jgi:hypothetical protein